MYEAIQQPSGKYRIANEGGRMVDIGFSDFDPITIDPAYSHHSVRALDPAQITLVPYVAPNRFDGMTVEQGKNYLIRRIDANTEQIIIGGFTFGEESFSSSKAAQLNILGTEQDRLAGVLTYPVAWSTLEGAATQFADEAAWIAFRAAAKAHIMGKKVEGVVLRSQVSALTTMEEIKAWTDPRGDNQ